MFDIKKLEIHGKRKKGKKEGKSRTPDLSLSLLSYLESKLFRALFTRVPSSTVGAE